MAMSKAKLPVADTEETEKPPPTKRLNGILRVVMERLGQPDQFLRVTARPVSGDNYRINVVVGPDITSSRIAHSFFVTADDDGTIRASVPPITKCY
jgi:hypothetical protein